MMMNKKFYGFFLVALVIGFALPRLALAEQKIAIVSLQKALNEVNEGKRAKAIIEADMNAKKKQLDSMKTDLKFMRDDLEKQKMVLAKDALEKKAGELQAKFYDLQQKAVQYEQELKQKEAESVQKILLALRDTVIQLAKDKKYDMVYENSAETVLYSSTAVDITSELIKSYNSKKK